MLSGEKLVGVFNQGAAEMEVRGDFPMGSDGFTAFQSWWLETNCVTMATVASGFRSIGLRGLANFQTAKSLEYGCNEEGGIARFDKVPPPGSFSGGQCAILYFVEYSWTLENSGVFTGAGNFLGPITKGELLGPDEIPGSPNQYGRARIEFDGGSQEAFPTSGSSSDPLVAFAITNVTPDGGGADVCGDNPDFAPDFEDPDNPAIAPAVGAVIRAAQDLTIQQDYGRGVEDIAFEIGELIFAGARGLTTSINGVPIRMSGDGYIYAGEPDPVQGEETFGTEEALEEIDEKLEEVISGELDVQDCDEQMQLIPYSGNGFLGLQSLILAQTEALAFKIDSLCGCEPSTPTLGPRTQLTQGVVGINDVIVANLPAMTRIVEIEIFGDENRVRILRPAGALREGKYGFYSFGFSSGGNDVYKEPRPLFYLNNCVMLPESLIPFEKLRLSLTTGLSYNVHIYAEEI